MKKSIHILLFSDTHLGFDQPTHPRTKRRRRGGDFFGNFQRVLDRALEKKVDLVVHGGDLFSHSQVSSAIIDQAYLALFEVANAGIPLVIVPGNHERSSLPGQIWLTHKNIYVFDSPKTFLLQTEAASIALSGFPFSRNAGLHFQQLLQQTSYRQVKADFHYLCLHQTFQGARVGPQNFTFRAGPDNISPADIPEGFSAALCGHIHRAQQLTPSPTHSPQAVPVVYPGSIERTSIAERLENKYFVLISASSQGGKLVQEIEFHQLPTRPMVKLEITFRKDKLDDIKSLIQSKLASLDPDSIVRIQIAGPQDAEILQTVTDPYLRAIAPPSMNITLANPGRFRGRAPDGSRGEVESNRRDELI